MLDGWSTLDFQAAAAYAESRPGSAARDSFRELLLQRALRAGGIEAARAWVYGIPENEVNRDYKQRAFGAERLVIVVQFCMTRGLLACSLHRTL